MVFKVFKNDFKICDINFVEKKKKEFHKDKIDHFQWNKRNGKFPKLSK